MKTTAVRLHGAMDLRLETFDLPEITADEILLRVESDTICASTYKATKQGSAHKRVPNDVAENPIIIGHEMCGTVEKVGENLKKQWKVGQRAVIQPALKLENFYDAEEYHQDYLIKNPAGYCHLTLDVYDRLKKLNEE